MTSEQLRDLENRLWKAADDLRANSKLTASEYSFPVLGLIFLRHAYYRYLAAKVEIEKTLPVHPTRGRRPIEKNDFLNARAIFLPETAQWETIVELPDSEDLGAFINEAMRTIEAEYEVLSGVLPKDYNLFDKDLLQRLVRIFNDDALDDVSGDVFGRIYEYFLNKFAMTGAQEGGEFFTPPSLVNTIVNIIEPDHGVVLDPACGSAGMFVQTAHFIEQEYDTEAAQKVTFYGQEKADVNTRLAKMNMAVHGLDAIIMQGNTFYEDQHDLVGQCDFVMANPPFNVDGVDKKKESVKQDARLPFGLPNNDNANYLWIQYFYSYLNEGGRAGFVMASSASDAGHSEKKIRQQLVETGAVDVMVAIGTKFFYTRSLPCTLWFYDRSKEKDPKRADHTLMLDLREVFRKVSSNLHDFTPEQLQNIHAIVSLYRGDATVLERAKSQYSEEIDQAKEEAGKLIHQLAKADLFSLPTNSLEPEKTRETKRALNASLRKFLSDAKQQSKTEEVKQDRELKEALRQKMDLAEELTEQLNAALDRLIYFRKEWNWLKKLFPDDKYADVPGLCKMVSRKEIVENDYSLTPGRYVGVAPKIDEDFDYEERMVEIKFELQELNKESSKLAQQIQEALKSLGI